MDIVERLRSNAMYAEDSRNEAADTIESLRARVQELEKDAERYRWLRDFDNTELYASWISQKLNDPETVEPFDFDEAIDAAIERSE